MSKPKSNNFTMNEFRSKDKTGHVQVPLTYWGNLQKLMNALEVIRKELGNKPIIINSGYRTKSHNSSEDVKGSSNSQHLTAKACDIRINGVTPNVIYMTIEKLINEGKIPQGGLGLYRTFVHYDIRGQRSRWSLV